MRVLHLIQSLDPRHGGPPEVVRLMAEEATRMGDTVEILCQDERTATFLVSCAFTVHAIGKCENRYGYARALDQWLAGNIDRFDALVIHGVWQYLTLAGARAALNRVPYFVFPHGAFDPWFKFKYPLKHLKKTVYWLWLYPVLRRAAAVLFTNSEESIGARKSFWPNGWRARTVPLGYALPVGNPEEQAAAFYDVLPNLRGQRYLLYMARIHPKKGCDNLVKAFARIAPKYPSVHLVIAGPDEAKMKTKLQAYIARRGLSDRVHWPGLLLGTEKLGAYRNCDAFVLPSHQENFGMAVVEALACGRPALISYHVPIWHDIVRDDAGLVGADTIAGTESLLDHWLGSSYARRQEMAAHAYPCFAQNFSMKKSIATLRAILSDMAEFGFVCPWRELL